jgi:nucleotide-binding universal stress UspA family protein
MKTILVPTAGSATDETVFKTALAIARPLDAHLEFLHVRIAATEAIVHTPHAGFARGAALRACFDELEQQAEERSVAAKRAFEQFCVGEHVPIVRTPHRLATISAGWVEEANDAPERLLFHARQHDLVVVGRARGGNGLPPDFLGRLLLGCGRPLLIAPQPPPHQLTGTVMVCWDDTAASARALTAAMPLLRRADRVLIATVGETEAAARAAAHGLAAPLAWSGIVAETIAAARKAGEAASVLRGIARDRAVDLVVMGGYGRGPIRELLFGGCTRTFLGQAELPVFMLH